jgi:hypothetical protein
MKAPLLRYAITAYSEWETLDVETDCPDDGYAINKARRYGSLQHISTNFPSVIFAHVASDEPDAPRDVGTWEYRLRHTKKPGFIWHPGTWLQRPMPEDRPAIRRWAAGFADGS